ncbi:hypothetical protein ACGFIR_09260 [Micromonospora sp. NPDC049051]|uniref:hypothetical protein n=1 Tax=Micromonospora sp. NPDC049051 TaxID=3364264 RepID=UPI00371D9B5E
MSRKDVLAYRDGLLSPAGDRRSWVRTATTGSTGEPVSVAHDATSRALEEQVLSQLVARHGGGEAWHKRGLIHVVLHPGGRSRGARSGWSPEATATKWNLIRAWQLDDEDFLSRLDALAGMIVTGSPSTLELVADRILDTTVGTVSRPALVVLSGEPVSTDVRHKVTDAMNCPVTSVYAMGEVGILGTECPDGGYHIEPDVAVVEVLDDRGDSVRDEDIGELTVTTLNNRAMPLVRYRTGDRVARMPRCGCQERGVRVRLAGVRPARWLVTDGGAAVHTVRFAKLWRTLQVSRAHLHQAPDGSVEAQYWARGPLTEGQQAVVVGSLKSALGRQKSITVTWRSDPAPRAQPDSPGVARVVPARAEPLPDAPGDVAVWLREALAPAADEIDAAVITGSFLDSTRGTRFSDIDVTILVSAPVQTTTWAERIRNLRAQLPRLRVNVEHPAGLAARSPLVVARMQQERLLVLGEMPLALTGWPDREALRRDALTWTWQSLPLIWHQLTAPLAEPADPVYVAYLAQKFIVDACRYRHLLSGGRTTGAPNVVAAEIAGLSGPVLTGDAWEAFEVARELRPPPPDEDGSHERYLIAAIAVLRALASALVPAT